MRYVTIIPARGGSKGIPKKNKKLLFNKPLISYTLEAVEKAGLTQETYVSSDDPEILDLASSMGVGNFGLRPEHLSTDNSSTADTLVYELSQFEASNGYRPDAVVTLQPTSPLRSYQTILEAIRVFEESGGDSLVSIQELDHNFNPESLMKLSDGNRLSFISSERVYSRHEKKRYFARNGAAIYVTKTETLLASNSVLGRDLVGFKMSKLESLDIDDDDDWQIAEALVRGLHSRS